MMKLKCEKCGHLWLPRKEEGLPIACPNCNSRGWRKNLKENEISTKSG